MLGRRAILARLCVLRWWNTRNTVYLIMRLPRISSATGSMLVHALLVVLFLTAVVLGYLVYEKFVNGRSVADVVERYAAARPVSDGESREGVDVAPDVSAYADMDLEQLVASMPNTGSASVATLERYGTEVNNRAVTAKTIYIGALCVAEPAIVAVTLGDTVEFSNADSMSHTLHLTPELVAEAPAGGTVSVVMEPATGAGMYGYVCDTTGRAAGIIVVR